MKGNENTLFICLQIWSLTHVPSLPSYSGHACFYKEENASVLFLAAIKLDEKRLIQDSFQKHGISGTGFFVLFIPQWNEEEEWSKRETEQ
jgi:hypothetical protein